MKIYEDIINKASKKNKCKNTFNVISTVQEFWQSLQESFVNAKIIEATEIMPCFSKTDNFRSSYQRNLAYKNLMPLSNDMWVEFSDEESGTNLGVLLTYHEIEEDDSLFREAMEYGIKSPFKWCCKSYSFIKQPLCKTVPLNWSLLEYIREDGTSAGSLLKPIQIPDSVVKNVEIEMENMRLLNHGIASLISDLALYLVESVHQDKAILKEHKEEKNDYYIALPV